MTLEQIMRSVDVQRRAKAQALRSTYVGFNYNASTAGSQLTYSVSGSRGGYYGVRGLFNKTDIDMLARDAGMASPGQVQPIQMNQGQSMFLGEEEEEDEWGEVEEFPEEEEEEEPKETLIPWDVNSLIYRSRSQLVRFNVFVDCTCDDWFYRWLFAANRYRYAMVKTTARLAEKLGRRRLSRGMNVTPKKWNPGGQTVGTCKHIYRALVDLSGRA